MYGALPTGFGEVECPTRANRLRPRRLGYWPILLIMGVGTKGAHHTSITKGTTRNRQVHTHTAAGKSTMSWAPYVVAPIALRAGIPGVAGCLGAPGKTIGFWQREVFFRA